MFTIALKHGYFLYINQCPIKTYSCGYVDCFLFNFQVPFRMTNLLLQQRIVSTVKVNSFHFNEIRVMTNLYWTNKIFELHELKL